MTSLVAKGATITAPSLLLPELAGAVSRRSGDTTLADSIVSLVRNLPYVRLVSIEEDFAQNAALVASHVRLKGGDAIYLALAAQLKQPLVTWDREQRERGTQLTAVLTPTDLLNSATP